MADSIDHVRATCAAIIADATPDVEPTLLYTEAPYHTALDTLPAQGTPRDHTRQFQVWADPPQEMRQQGSCFVCEVPLRIVIRYDVSMWDDRQAMSRLINLAVSDQMRISKEMQRAPGSTTWGAPVEDPPQFIGATEPVPSSAIANMWIAEQTYLVGIKLAG